VQSGKLFAAGAERVTDGVHTETILSKGKTYKLTLVCVGATVQCDQSLVQQRIAGDGPVRINVDAAEGASGVIAWQVDAI
jgi:hypothetical protein